jgi:hypothetical protein
MDYGSSRYRVEPNQANPILFARGGGDQLKTNADTAIYRAKKHSRGNVLFGQWETDGS